MEWKEEKDCYFFHEGIGTYEDSPIGKVYLGVGLGKQGILAVVGEGDESRTFVLDPQNMLEGLMELLVRPYRRVSNG